MRPEPQPSAELLYLNEVLTKKEEHDDPDDPQLAFYRNLMKTQPARLQAQKQKAEDKFRSEMDTWYRDKEIEDKELAKEAREEKFDNPRKGKDVGTARCLEKLRKLVGELTGKEPGHDNQ